MTTATATATKTSLKNFIALIPSRSVRQMVANFSGVEFLKTVSKFRRRKRKSLGDNKKNAIWILLLLRRQENYT